MGVAAGRSTEPLKDLDIQPGGLEATEWNQLLDLAQKAGVSVIALDVNWAAYEPSGPAPRYEFSELSRFASDVLGRGLELRFQLVGFPQWARSRGDPSEAAQPLRAPASPAELALWSHWVKRLVSHFGSEVSYYEIWNEENTTAFWAQGANPTEYARLLEASYVAAKAADPKAVIMFGGMSRNDIGFLHADLPGDRPAVSLDGRRRRTLLRHPRRAPLRRLGLAGGGEPELGLPRTGSAR